MKFTDYNEWEDFTYYLETVVSPYVFDTDRWHQYWEMIVKDKDGKFWKLSWREGATEYQELDFDQMDYKAIEVEPYEVTVTKYKPIAQ